MVKCLGIYIFLVVSLKISTSLLVSHTFPQLTPISHFQCFSQFIESLSVTLFSSDPHDFSTVVISNVGRSSVHALSNAVLQRSFATPSYTLMLFAKDNAEISCLYSADPQPLMNVTGVPLAADGAISTKSCYVSSPLRETMLEIYQQHALQSLVRTITWTCSLISPVGASLLASVPPITVTVAQESRQDLSDFDPAPISSALADRQLSFMLDTTPVLVSAHRACVSVEGATCAGAPPDAPLLNHPAPTPALPTPAPPTPHTPPPSPHPLATSVVAHGHSRASLPTPVSSLVELGLSVDLPADALGSSSSWLLTLPCYYRYLPTATIFVEEFVEGFSTEPAALPPLRVCEYLVHPADPSAPSATQVLCPAQLTPGLVAGAPLANVLHGIPVFGDLLWVANHTASVEHVLTQKSSVGNLTVTTVTAVLAVGHVALYTPMPRRLAFTLQDRSAVQAQPAVSFTASFEGTVAVLRGDRFSLESAGLFALPGLRVTVRSSLPAPPISCSCAVAAAGAVYSCEVLETVVGVPSVVFSVYGAVLEQVSRPLFVTARALSQGRVVHVVDARAVVAPPLVSPAPWTWVIAGCVVGGAVLLAAGAWLIVRALRRPAASTTPPSAAPPGAPSRAAAAPRAAAGVCVSAGELELPATLASAHYDHYAASPRRLRLPFNPPRAALSSSSAHWAVPVRVSRSPSDARSLPDGEQTAPERPSATHVLVPVTPLRTSSSSPVSTDISCAPPHAPHASARSARWSRRAAADVSVMCPSTQGTSRSQSPGLGSTPSPTRTHTHIHTHAHAPTGVAGGGLGCPSRSPHAPRSHHHRRVRSSSPPLASQASRRSRGHRLRCRGCGVRRSESWLPDALVAGHYWTLDSHHCSQRQASECPGQALLELSAPAHTRPHPHLRALSQPPSSALLCRPPLLGPGAGPHPSLAPTRVCAPPAAAAVVGDTCAHTRTDTCTHRADSASLGGAAAQAAVGFLPFSAARGYASPGHPVAATGTAQPRHHPTQPRAVHAFPLAQRRRASFLVAASVVASRGAPCADAPMRAPVRPCVAALDCSPGAPQQLPPPPGLRRRSFTSHADTPGGYHAEQSRAEQS